MKGIICLLILLFSSLYPAQSENDTLQKWISGFSRLASPIYSESGRWVAVRKRYDLSQDTLLLADIKRPEIVQGSINFNGETTFIKEGILVFGKGQAEFWNLATNQRYQHHKVKMANPLPLTGRYAILDQDAVITVYNSNYRILHQIKEVQELPVSDRKGKLYVYRKNATGYEILNLSGDDVNILRSTANPIRKLELSNSGKYLVSTEIEESSDTSKLVFINTLNGKVIEMPRIRFEKDDYYKLTEIQNGKAIFVSLHGSEKLNNKLVDIWYGDDENLKTRKNGLIKNSYWLWKSEEGSLIELKTDVFPVFASINSDRYFLAFHPTKEHDYLTYEPQLRDVHLFDAQQNTYRKLQDLKGVNYGSSEIICSYDGKYLMGSEDGKSWSLFEISSWSKIATFKSTLGHPVFTMDGQCILFESPSDLWRYEIGTKKLAAINISKNNSIQVINTSNVKISDKWNISVNTVDQKKPLLLKILDQSKSTVSFFTWQKGNKRQIIAPTANYVENILPNLQFTSFCFLEENYNSSPKLFVISGSKPKTQILYTKSNTDKTALSLKQEIIHYASEEGIPLKGILYYPVNFKPQKKYPMVVHIYQIQSGKGNQYLTPGYHNRDGLDIRTLLEKGYFVLLPDTFQGTSGAGFSALYCVNKALDIVRHNPSIDISKVGLIGHSFGGYETNFIATHSNRFATYISGAGISDIIRSYFSYNYHFLGPYFWQYENGIFQMKSYEINKSVYLSNNPVLSVEKVNAPILLWAGNQDENVPWDQTMELYLALKRHSKRVIALFYPNGRHTLNNASEEKRDLHRKVLEWWDYYLRDKKDVLWINK